MIKQEDIEKAYREAEVHCETPCGISVKAVYTPDDIAGTNFERDIGLPGEYPFTRGHSPLMYRGKLWNIRQITGLSTPERLNERHKYVMSLGQNALNWECDAPTLYGVEPDNPAAEGLNGVAGVTLHTLRDVERLCQDIPYDTVSVAISGNVGVAQSYLLMAKRAGYDVSKLRMVWGALHYYTPPYYGNPDTLYADGHLSTYARWANDLCEYQIKNMPKSNSWFACGDVHLGGGANGIQEAASIIACGKEFIREMLRRGVDINTMGRMLTVNFSYCYDFFEDIAKARATRRYWARMMKEEFGATDPKAMILRHHAIVSGTNYTRQQPLLNIARGTLRGLSAVLAGAIEIQLAAWDEALSTPSEDGHRTAIRTQQVIRYESGVTKVADPLAGSYYVEWLTNRMEEEIGAMVKEIEDRGGWLAVLMNGWYMDEVRKTELERRKKIESGETLLVGDNCFSIPPEEDFQPKPFVPDRTDIEKYVSEFKEFKKKRDNNRIKKALENLRRAAEKPDENLLPYTDEALLAGAAIPEIRGVLRMVDGLPYDYAKIRQYPFS